MQTAERLTFNVNITELGGSISAFDLTITLYKRSESHTRPLCRAPKERSPWVKNTNFHTSVYRYLEGSIPKAHRI